MKWDITNAGIRQWNFPCPFHTRSRRIVGLTPRGREKLRKEGRGAGQTFHPPFACWSFIRDLFGRSVWSSSCAGKDVLPLPPKIPLGSVDEVFPSQEWLKRLLWIPKSCMEMDKPAPLQQGGLPKKDQPAFLGKGHELMEPLKLFITLKTLGSF